MKIRYRKVVKVVQDILTEEKAKELIVEAKINFPGELGAYEQHSGTNGYIHRVFTLEIPVDMLDTDDLLEYARNNMPEHITFGAN